MPRFAYEAAGPDGTIGRGTIEASDRSAAVARILALGQTPVRVAEQASVSSSVSSPRIGASRERLSLLRELATLLNAGLSVERALVAMHGLNARARTKREIQAVLDGLRSGESLSDSMRRADNVFPEPVRRMVAAGEVSGRLADVMNRLADTEARHKELGDRALSAMIYPALLTVVMIVVLTIIFTVVVPRLEPLFAEGGEALPWPAAALMAASHFFNSYGTMLAIALIAALAAALYALRMPGVRVAFDRWSLSTRLLLGVPRLHQGAQFCRNMAMLLDGGLPLHRALENAQAASGNSFVRRRLGDAIEMVRQGRPLKAALEAVAVFPRAVTEFAAVGEETGRPAAMMNEAANILDRQMQTMLDRLSALLLPGVTIILGIVVAGIMAGVMGGILAANDLAL